MSHDSKIVPEGQTFILTGYTIPCDRTVVAWEFCYQIFNAKPVTFYPGIWRIMGADSAYELIQSNSVTYHPINISGVNSCQRVNLSTTDQFTAPARSVMGVYFKVHTQLLHTNANSSITTYQFSGNQSSISSTSNRENVNYSIAIRLYLGKYS